MSDILNLIFKIIMYVMTGIFLIFLMFSIFFFKPRAYGSKYIVAKKRRGKSSLGVFICLLVMRDKKRLQKANEKINRLSKGGFERLKPTKQLVYSDVRIARKDYHKTPQPTEITRDVSQYISGYNVGAKHSLKLFDVTIPPHAHLFLDEINKYYNSRESIDFPDAVATYYQTDGHNNCSFVMTSHRVPEADSKIREIMDYYEHIRFKKDCWVCVPKFKKRFPFVSLKKLTFFTIWRVWQYTDIEHLEQKRVPHHLFIRFLRWLCLLPYENGRKIYCYWGNIYKHYDSEYLKPYHYCGDSEIKLSVPPYHNYDLKQYENFIKSCYYVRPLEFGKVRKSERREQARKLYEK